MGLLFHIFLYSMQSYPGILKYRILKRFPLCSNIYAIFHLSQEEEDLINAHRRQVEETMNIVRMVCNWAGLHTSCFQYEPSLESPAQWSHIIDHSLKSILHRELPKSKKAKETSSISPKKETLCQ